MRFSRPSIFPLASIFAAALLFAACDSGSSEEAGADSGTPSRLETFNPNILNNIVQDPDDPAVDGIYPEFVLNLEEASPDDRDIASVTAHWPDGRQTALEEDFRPGDGILRWVKHDLDRFGTEAPSGIYRFEVRLASSELIEVTRTFEQRVLGRPQNVTVARSNNDVVVSWTSPDAPHLYSMDIVPADPQQNVPLARGPQARTAEAGEHISYTFQSPALTTGTTYHVKLIFSDRSNLRSHLTPFEM